MGTLVRSIVSACAVLAGCSGGDSPRSLAPTTPTQAEVTEATFVPEVSWTPCALESDEADRKTVAECALVDVPLVWGSAGEHLHVFVKHVHAPPTGAGGAPLRAGVRSRAALWLLGRHAGSSGADLEKLARELAMRDGSLDVYLPDARGSGRSTRLACPPQEAAASPAGFTITSSEWEACVEHIKTEWGPRLASFDVTSAARDIAAIAARVAGHRDSFLYGAGTGSYLAARVLTVSDQPFAGVIYDSPCLPGSCKGSREDERYLGAGKRLLDACARDATCRAKLGPDPWARIGEALDAVDSKRCAPLSELGIDRTAVRALYSSWLADPERLPLVPALTYRILRCAGGDARTLAKFATDLTGPTRVTPDERWASRVLAAHVTLSELWETPAPSADQLFAIAESSYVSRGAGPELAKLYDVWPRYTDPLANTWPVRRLPTLVLSGSLDPDDGLDDAARAELVRRGAAIVELEGVTGGVALGALRRDGRSCGVELLGAFVDDPTVRGHECTSDLAALDFRGSAALAEATFGSSDLWEPNP